MTQVEKKSFWKSKTKVGALIVGLGAVLGTLGGMISGSIDISIGITTLITEIGAVLGIAGLRDLPFVNKV